ncbi:MAG: Asp-tRNA(Asn)/Glu-tRNA(Gln) amidotransferase subunit GatB [Patescibacteria group bacterium]
MNYEPIIGIEIHVELGTLSKMFCGCPADHFGKEPNTQTCPVCLGLPGALPVPNKKAVEWTMLLGLALGCTINKESKFDRKHYFYPDLPKGYQISQYDAPLVRDGVLKLKVKSHLPANTTHQALQAGKLKVEEEKSIRIRRVHLEEDTGKLQHAVIDGKRVSLVDFNRSGVPLVEIVTEPDFRSTEEVDMFAKKLQQIVRYLGISGADMEKGSMRIEPSISLRKSEILNPKSETNSKFKIQNSKLPDYRVEIKNINSFKFARNAITYEIERQTEMLEHGDTPTQQTRGYVEAKGVTVPQREKEEAHDYRYFPEPDIPPMRFAQEQIAKSKEQIGEMPDEKKERFIKEYGLSEYDATILTEDRLSAEYFEDAVKCQKSKARPPARQVKSQEVSSKTIANWIINKKVDRASVTPTQLLDQIIIAAQSVFVSGDELESIVTQVLDGNPKAAREYKNGKEPALMFLVGQAMRLAKGKSTAEDLRKKIIELISK